MTGAVVVDEVAIALPAGTLDGLTAEQRSEMVRLAEESAIAKAAEIRERRCPDWCDRAASRHQPGEWPMHMGDVGSLGVGLQRHHDEGPTVWVPAGTGGEPVSATVARQLAADLIAAADLLERATS